MSGRAPLPIDPHLPAVCAAMARGNLVLVAEPGAGKTTRVPPALADAQVGGGKRIVVLEPRRLAARAAARRVADEMGTRVGGAVGYEVRFDRQVGPDTRVLFLTEGLLARRLMSDPTLADVGAVLIDEFHERHLTGDLTLALLRRAQRTARPDLRLAVLSATIDPAPIAAFLGGPILSVEGRVHPVAIDHAAQPPDGPLDREVARAVGRVVREEPDGHVLVFLPGAAEIRRAIDACAELAARRELLLLPLHGALSPDEQDRALAPSDRRKIVFATNVAETSITIDGVAAVIDAGTARVARHDPWSGLGALRVEPISRASAAQRAGRAGRTRPGRCLRLYTRHDHDTRREFDAPEIERADLAEAVLALRAAGVAPGESLDWFEPPPAPALAAAEALLARLGAIDPQLTEVGRRMMRFPLHPRAARVLVEAERRGLADDGCLVAAALAEEGRRDSRPRVAVHASPSDVLDRADAAAGERGPAARAAAQLRRLIDRRAAAPRDPHERDRALLLALLTGFPDRVARRRRPGAPDLLLCVSAGGGAALLHPSSAVLGDPAELVIAVDVEEQGRGQSRQVSVRTASAVDPAWLYELYIDQIADSDELRFDPAGKRVERVRRLSYDGLVLEETREIDPRRLDLDAAGRVLAGAARAAGIDSFIEPAALAHLRARADLAAQAAPAAAIAPVTDGEIDDVIAAACRDGATSFADLRAASLLDRLWQARGPAQRRALDRLAPESIGLPGRKRVPVHYQPDRPPWIESRLQDFFGLVAGPAIADGAVPLVLHLLAPNGRAVQVTSDLARFWEVHYPSIRRELARRYPRHAWPESPSAATRR